MRYNSGVRREITTIISLIESLSSFYRTVDPRTRDMAIDERARGNEVTNLYTLTQLVCELLGLVREMSLESRKLTLDRS
jgi:hypothetical protein